MNKVQYFYQIKAMTVLLDESDCWVPMRWALSWQEKKKDIRLQLQHVLKPLPTYMSEILFPYVGAGIDRTEIEAELVQSAQHFFEKRCRDWKIELKEFKPWVESQTRKFQNFMLQVESDLIVLSEHSNVFGQVFKHLIRPTLVVRDLGEKQAVKKILVAWDGSRENLRLLPWAVSLGAFFHAKVELLTVLPSPLDQMHEDFWKKARVFWDRRSRSTIEKILEERRERALNECVIPFAWESQYDPGPLPLHISIDDPLHGIVRRVLKKNFDLLVISNHHPKNQNASLGRLAQNLLIRAPSHVLVIPMEWLQNPEALG